MSAELLRRAAQRLLDEDVPDGKWEYSPVDPRPNFGLWCDRSQVLELNWGKESFVLPELLALLLNSRRALAAVLDGWADTVEETDKHLGRIPDDLFVEEFALARAILREPEDGGS